jgi:UDP-N-acetylmuramoyl-L-alanyl-D-glutamate--2,6-diaminopimelate ligase
LLAKNSLDPVKIGQPVLPSLFEFLTFLEKFMGQNIEQIQVKQGILTQQDFQILTLTPQNRNDFQDYPIQGITLDSRIVDPGWVFLGSCATQEIWKKNAWEQGAIAVILFKDGFDCPMTQKNIDQVFDFVYPLDPDCPIVCVTGTNGKSSIVHFIGSLLKTLGQKCGLIGTLGIRSNINDQQTSNELFPSSNPTEGKVYQSTLTMPDRSTLRYCLHRFQHLHKSSNPLDPKKPWDFLKSHPPVVLEASSHGLCQGRLRNTLVSTGIFTNFSHDHLDYHQSIENYFNSKKKLFTQCLKEGGSAILWTNITRPNLEELLEICQKRSIRVYLYGPHDTKIETPYPYEGLCTYHIHHYHPNGQDVELRYAGQSYRFFSPLIGDFQIANLTAALLTLCSWKIPLQSLIPHISMIKGEKGRMECTVWKQEKSFEGKTMTIEKYVHIDYAHTPDALEQALGNLKKHTKGSLAVVFGCGGNRDATKRPIMGEIASKLADYVVLTDDNPRFEDPASIRNDILKGIFEKKHFYPDGSQEKEGLHQKKVFNIAGRQNAIDLALKNLDNQGALLIAGKGHETYQSVEGKNIHFSDHEAVEAAMLKLGFIKQ